MKQLVKFDIERKNLSKSPSFGVLAIFSIKVAVDVVGGWSLLSCCKDKYHNDSNLQK